jgi:sodium pump decarboxylase gamma subunit
MPAAQYSNLFVVLMGIGTVFFGLICIIFLTQIMGKIMGSMTPPPKAKANDTRKEVAKVAEAHPQVSSGIPPAVVVAIMAALSEDPSISAHGYHITSIKKSI